jgi:hypothetical protein
MLHFPPYQSPVLKIPPVDELKVRVQTGSGTVPVYNVELVFSPNVF